MDTDRFRLSEGEVASVPMARGKHLFPCRTQQLSLAAVTILGVHPWENSTVPNYTKSLRIGRSLSLKVEAFHLEGFSFCLSTSVMHVGAAISQKRVYYTRRGFSRSGCPTLDPTF